MVTLKKSYIQFLIIVLFAITINSCQNSSKQVVDNEHAVKDSRELNFAQVDSLYAGGTLARICFKNIIKKYEWMKSSFIAKEDVLNDTTNYNINFLNDSINKIVIANSQVTFGYEQRAYLFSLTENRTTEIGGIVLKCFKQEKNLLVEKDLNVNGVRESHFAIVDYAGKEILRIGNCSE